MFGIIGVGAAGSNVADEFSKLGMPSLAINFSSKDLDSLEFVVEKYKLVGSEGVGKQRNHAVKLMNNNWESVVEFIKMNFSQPSVEIILVCFSTGGGTGSGISPLISEILQDKMPDKIIVACPILSDVNEFAGNQVNTLEALEELRELDIAVMPIDNQSLKDEHLPKNKLYQKINSKFVDLIHKIGLYTEKESKYGIVDKRDLRQLFNTRGILIISEANLTDVSNFTLTTNHFTEGIQNSWKKSIFTPIQYEQIIKAGIIFDGDEKLLEYLRTDKLFDVFANDPIELFEGFYTGGNGKVISILSGLNWIYQRIEGIDSVIDKHKANIDKIEENSYKSRNTNKSSLFDSVAKQVDTVPKKRLVSDIIKKYSR